MCFKIINNISPNDLDLQIIKSDRRGIKLKVPPLRMDATQRARSMYESSFAVVGPKLWNTLPSKISTMTNKDSFKIALSKHIAMIPDEPPIDGYTRHNSLLEYNRLQLAGGQNLIYAAPAAHAAAAAVDDDDDLPYSAY